ncbi:hypothetical protein [Butyricicoccus sp. Marseille-Q5471]|uniref:hypothetical protein n=1 Tax=Butyricicoccus sp. Marseille-Q5471 TaxID=3039493 RepID=UPI0024BC24EC|nr:hypothetical protein [Butyricicoccus sp. Marseille-Q5471]
MGLLSSIIGSVVKATSNAAQKTNSSSKGSGASSSGSSGGGSNFGGYYDKNTDYEAKINEAVSKGDYNSAAQYEQFRNNKIQSEGLNYSTTDRFSQYLPKSESGYIPGQNIQSGADYINQMYNAQKQAQIAGFNKQYEQFRAQNEADMSAVPKQYQTTRDQSELERYKAQKALKQQMADSGTTYSGQGRQATLDAENAASTRLTSINTAEQGALNDLRLALKNAQLARDSGIATAEANADASSAQALLNDLYRQQDAKREDYWNSKNFNLSEAGLTGYYNGNKTMQNQYQDYQISADKRDYDLKVRELEDQLATNKITRAQYEEELKALKRGNQIGDKYDDARAAAELAALQASAAGKSSGGSRTYQGSVNTDAYSRQSDALQSADNSASIAVKKQNLVIVPGYGRMTFPEVESLIDKGYVKEIVDPITGRRSYKKVN